MSSSDLTRSRPISPQAHLRRVLRDALALAIALNRTLVLPRMLCYCDNIWKEMKHCRVGGAFDMTLPFDCPADHIINLVGWFDGSLPIVRHRPGPSNQHPRLPMPTRAPYAAWPRPLPTHDRTSASRASSPTRGCRPSWSRRGRASRSTR